MYVVKKMCFWGLKNSSTFKDRMQMISNRIKQTNKREFSLKLMLCDKKF